MNYVEMRFAEGDKNLLCRLYNKDSKKLIVFFSALRPLKIKASAFYNRITWVDLFSYNCLFIADPTIFINRNLRGGYYQATENWYGAQYCAEIILRVAASLNIIESDILLYGSSQGGFASLATYAFIRNAKVLAESPQTDLSILSSAKYERLSMIKSVYNADTFDQLSEESRIKTNIMMLYEVYPPLIDNVNIIVKETDHIHLKDHILPLKVRYKDINVDFIKGEKGLGGHSAIDRVLIRDKVISILESE